MEAKGSLRKNLKKEKDSQPDLTGKWTDADGQTYWLSAWRNVDQESGNIWWSLKRGALVEERKAPARAVSQHSAAKANAFVEDDIPF